MGALLPLTSTLGHGAPEDRSSVPVSSTSWRRRRCWPTTPPSTSPLHGRYPAILVRWTGSDSRIYELIVEETWLARAPTRLAKAYLDTSL